MGLDGPVEVSIIRPIKLFCSGLVRSGKGVTSSHRGSFDLILAGRPEFESSAFRPTKRYWRKHSVPRISCRHVSTLLVSLSCQSPVGLFLGASERKPPCQCLQVSGHGRIIGPRPPNDMLPRAATPTWPPRCMAIEISTGEYGRLGGSPDVITNDGNDVRRRAA